MAIHSLVRFFTITIAFVLSLYVYSPFTFGATSTVPVRFKILHIMSYHSPWRWTDDQLSGFKEGLGVNAVEYKVFQMNTKLNSTDDAKQLKANEAQSLIETWKPDLVYTSDDDAQQWVTKDYINKDVPFVFSGVNKTPELYGFTGVKNITGVVEHEHFLESVNLLKAINPKIKKLAVVFDDAPMWQAIRKRITTGLQELPNKKTKRSLSNRTKMDHREQQFTRPGVLGGQSTLRYLSRCYGIWPGARLGRRAAGPRHISRWDSTKRTHIQNHRQRRPSDQPRARKKAKPKG